MKPNKFAVLVTGSLFALFLTACGNTSENSMMTDGKNKVVCVEGGCADTTANSLDVSLRPTKTTTQYVTTATGRLEIQGDCYVSTYPENYITLTIKNGATAVTPPTIAMTSQNNKLACDKGKFFFILDASALAQGSYTVAAQLYVKGADGVVQSPTNAKFSVSLIKTP